MDLSFRDIRKATQSLSKSAHDALFSGPQVPPRARHTPGPKAYEPCPDNMTMLEAFEWNCPKDHKHWTRLAAAMPSLKSIGIDNIWVPPGCKGGWHGSNGYDVYDLYDLGEFQQKDSRQTKWGTKEELMDMVRVAANYRVGIYWDAVLNHRAAADFSEPCYAVKVDPEDRTKEVGKPIEIEAWTGFDFADRDDRHSQLKYRWQHFSGTDYDHRTKKNGIFKFLGQGKKSWAKDVDDELGNYDYLMFANVDYSNQEVRQDVFRWGEWIGRELGLSGIRFDAVKHFSEAFLKDFIRHLDSTVGGDWFLVGEYWRDDVETLAGYIQRMDNRMSLFDVPLVSNLARLSTARKPDLRTVFQRTLALHCPQNAVTFAQNHDTVSLRFDAGLASVLTILQQERGSLETIVKPDFLAHAYALILLRLTPSYPCVFYGDLYGILGSKSRPPACGGKLPKMVSARKLWAYGAMDEYWDTKECVGWTRHGHPSHSAGAGLAVILNASYASCFKQRMNVGKQHAGESWTDILGWAWDAVTIDRAGWAVFPVGPRSVGVWVHEQAEGRPWMDGLEFDDDIYKYDAEAGP